MAGWDSKAPRVYRCLADSQVEPGAEVELQERLLSHPIEIGGIFSLSLPELCIHAGGYRAGWFPKLMPLFPPVLPNRKKPAAMMNSGWLVWRIFFGSVPRGKRR
jgi:hypothetical protein